MEVWWISLGTFIAGLCTHYFICRSQMRRYVRRFNEQQERQVQQLIEEMTMQNEKQLLKLIEELSEELTYVMNHEGIKPISATSRGLVDITMWDLNHYIDELKKLQIPSASPILTIILGLQAIRNEELAMLWLKMRELQVAVDKMLESPIKFFK